MKIAYCSPFPPVKSGISDFSEDVVQELKNNVDLDLFSETKIESKNLISQFNCYDLNKLNDDNFAAQYDLIVYQMGNNYECHKGIGEMILKRPGILELHDISLHHFLAEDKFANNKIDDYKAIVKYCHGEKGVKIVDKFLDGKAPAPWEEYPLELPVNKHYVDNSLGVIVHSDMAKQMVKAERIDIPVVHIPHYAADILPNTLEGKYNAKRKIGIPENCYVFGSFGFATKTKRITQTLEALAKYKKHDFRFVVIGKEIGINISQEAERLGIKDKVIVTGYISLDDYKLYMQACDICFNLRFPTNGESSGNLQRILGMGIPAIVTDVGTFSEYTDSCTVKVSYGNNEETDILKAIDKLTSDRKTYEKYSRNATEFIKETADIKVICQKYTSFFEDVKNGTFAETDEVEILLDNAIKNGFTDEEYLVKLLQNAGNK